MVNALSEQVKNNQSIFKHGLRYVGDSNCWVVDLSPKFEIPAEINVAKNLVEANTWGLYFSKAGRTKMVFNNLSAGNLQFDYIVADAKLEKYLERVLQSPSRG